MFYVTLVGRPAIVHQKLGQIAGPPEKKWQFISKTRLTPYLGP
jgi:hypothetical protein